MLIEMINKASARILVDSKALILEEEPVPSDLLKKICPGLSLSEICQYPTLSQYFKGVTGRELPAENLESTIFKYEKDFPELENIAVYLRWLDKAVEYAILGELGDEILNLNVKLSAVGNTSVRYSDSWINYMCKYFPVSLIARSIAAPEGYFKVTLEIPEPTGLRGNIRDFEQIVQYCGSYVMPAMLWGKSLIMFVRDDKIPEFNGRCEGHFNIIKYEPFVHVYSQVQLDKWSGQGYSELIEICFGRTGSEARVCGKCKAEVKGNYKVKVSGHTVIRAYDKSVVIAEGNSSVYAHDEVRVIASGDTGIQAKGKSDITARGHAGVSAFDNAKVAAWENSSVVAHDYAYVIAYDKASVELEDTTEINVNGEGKITDRRDNIL